MEEIETILVLHGYSKPMYSRARTGEDNVIHIYKEKKEYSFQTHRVDRFILSKQYGENVFCSNISRLREKVIKYITE